MKVKIKQEFRDKLHFPTKYLVGSVVAFEKDRAEELISKGLVEKYVEEEVVEDEIVGDEVLSTVEDKEEYKTESKVEDKPKPQGRKPKAKK